MVYSLLIDLPYSPALRRMHGVHLVKDGGLSNDTYEVELDKVIISSWTYTESEPHECYNEAQDCNRCSQNLDVEVEHLEISPIRSKTKLVFERHCSHQIGSVFSNWYAVALE